MNEVFAKVVELSFEQRSQWEHCVSNFGSNSDCALCIDQRGVCVRQINCVSCTWFTIKKKAIGKEELFQERAESWAAEK